MANRVGMPNIQQKGLGHVTAQKEQPQQSSSSAWYETIVPLAVGAITTAALSSLLTPAGGGAVGSFAGQMVGRAMQDAPPERVGAPVQNQGMGGPKPLGAQEQLQSLVQPEMGPPAPAQQVMPQPSDGGASRAGAMMRGFARAQQ